MKNKILIIEDEIDLREILSDNFSEDNWEIFLAHNGKSGLESALKNHPDIILLDIVMPVMNGMKMLDELRKDSWGKDARVILLTNLTVKENDLVSSQRGIKSFDYWIKCDMTMADIVAKVNQRMKKKD